MAKRLGFTLPILAASLFIGTFTAQYSQQVVADNLDECIEQFEGMYSIYRNVLGAKILWVTCEKEMSMPIVWVNAILTEVGDGDKMASFMVRGREPKRYLQDIHAPMEKECDMQGPQEIDKYHPPVIEYELTGRQLAQWHKFVINDVCEIALTDWEADLSE